MWRMPSIRRVAPTGSGRCRGMRTMITRTTAPTTIMGMITAMRMITGMGPAMQGMGTIMSIITTVRDAAAGITNTVRSGIGMAEETGPVPAGDAFVKLMTWLSPAFPVGAFTYSHGLEWAIEDGTVTRADALAEWIGAILRHGAGRADGILLAHAHRAAAAGHAISVQNVAELAFALQPSKERRLEASAQGKAFGTAIEATWGAPTLARLIKELAPTPITYAVAVGVAAADHGLPLPLALEAFLTAFAANLVSAAVRAVPLGQTDGQRVIRDLAPVVAAVAEEALAADLDDVGGAALRADIASMKHETQYTRLFRS